MTAPATHVGERRVVTLDEPDSLGAVLRALDQRREGRSALVVHASAPLGDPLALLDLASSEPASAWFPPTGPQVAAIGVAARIDASGPGRFAAVREGADALLGAVEIVGDGPTPRLFGGFAFAEGAAHEPPWAAFGDASFVLPRFTYTKSETRATLTLALTDHADVSSSALREELRAIYDALARPRSRGRVLAPVRDVQHLSLELYREEIERIRAAIDAGSVSKIVAARRSLVVLEEPVDARLVLERLVARFSGCTGFAFRRGGATFVGATPERLLAVDGRSVATEALAGTIAASTERAEEKLRDSAKDREEQRMVTSEIERRLAPFCTAIRTQPEPSIRRLPNVLHLATPIVGELDAPTHVLDLVEALHPTPAVGGVPTDQAVAWIVRAEAAPRGWYAGPIGWLDGSGAGDFAVALRSGLLFDDRAWLYAGGGIVRGSEADAEYDETAIKLDALLSALTTRDEGAA